MSRRRSIVPCGIDAAIWKRSEQMMLASTGRTVLCQTLIAIMRQRALPNASIAVARIMTRFQRRWFSYQYWDWSRSQSELAAVQDKIQTLWTTGCGCTMNHYLQFGEGQLVSLFSRLGWLSKGDKITLHFWVSWQCLCRLLCALLLWS